MTNIFSKNIWNSRFVIKLHKAFSKVRNSILRATVRRTYSQEDTVLVLGSGRSGTTWLVEMMNSNRNFRIVFEPFYRNHRGDIVRVLPTKLFLSPKDPLKYSKEFGEILLGNIYTPWVDMIASTNYFASKQIVKEIRLNRMVSWIQQKFPRLKIVAIVRDPYSVAFSAAEHNWYPADIKNYMPPAEATKYFTRAQLSILSQASNLFQRNIAMWAVDNHMLLRHSARNKNIRAIYYENMATHPEQTMKNIMSFCGVRYTPGKLLSTTKSTLATKRTVTDTSSKQFGKRWQGKITQADDEYAVQLIKAFKFTKLYVDRNQPAGEDPFDFV